MRTYSHADISKQPLVHDFEVPHTAQRLHITYADAADPPGFAAQVAERVGRADDAHYTSELARAIAAAVDDAIDVGADGGVFDASLNISGAVCLNDGRRGGAGVPTITPNRAPRSALIASHSFLLRLNFNAFASANCPKQRVLAY